MAKKAQQPANNFKLYEQEPHDEQEPHGATFEVPQKVEIKHMLKRPSRPNPVAMDTERASHVKHPTSAIKPATNPKRQQSTDIKQVQRNPHHTKNNPRCVGNRNQVLIMTIARKLKYLRQSFKLSQVELGKIMGGITFQQVQKYEKGTNIVPLDRLLMLAEKLELSIDFFVKDGNDNAMQTHTKETQQNAFQRNGSLEQVGAPNSSEILQLATVFYDLPEEKRNALLVLCDLKKTRRSMGLFS